MNQRERLTCESIYTKILLNNIVFDYTEEGIASTFEDKKSIANPKQYNLKLIDDNEYIIENKLYYEREKYNLVFINEIKSMLRALQFNSFIKENSLKYEDVTSLSHMEDFKIYRLIGINFEIIDDQIVLTVQDNIDKTSVSILLYSNDESYILDGTFYGNEFTIDIPTVVSEGNYKVFVLLDQKIYEILYSNPNIISIQPFKLVKNNIVRLSYENNSLIIKKTKLNSFVSIEDVVLNEDKMILSASINDNVMPKSVDFIFKGRKGKTLVVSADIDKAPIIDVDIPYREFYSEKFTDIYLLLNYGTYERACVLSQRESYFEKSFTIKNRGVRIQTTKEGNVILATVKDKSWITKKRNNIRHNLMKLLQNYLTVDDNRVIFESFGGRQYSDHPKAIYEYIKKGYPSLKCIWSANADAISTFKKNKVPYVKRFSLRWFYYMAKSKYWVMNARLPLWVTKPKGTIYLQTWHGTPLKRLGTDIGEVHMPNTNTFNYNRNFYRESRNWDYLVSPNRFSTNIFSRAFTIPKEKILECGSPRNDFLVQNKDNTELIVELKKKYGIPLDKKVILYAPTWRDDQFYAKSKYKFDNPIDLEKFKSELSKDYALIFRMHYLVADRVNLEGYEDFAFNISDGDIAPLYLISDILITDYSSVYFDYAVLRRPMVFFMYDIEDYRDRLRGFYLDVETSMPGPIAKTNDELIEAIKNIDDDIDLRLQRFVDIFCELEDGNATKRVCDIVFKDL